MVAEEDKGQVVGYSLASREVGRPKWHKCCNIVVPLDTCSSLGEVENLQGSQETIRGVFYISQC